jgi:hypothetical protein
VAPRNLSDVIRATSKLLASALRALASLGFRTGPRHVARRALRLFVRKLRVQWQWLPAAPDARREVLSVLAGVELPTAFLRAGDTLSLTIAGVAHSQYVYISREAECIAIKEALIAALRVGAEAACAAVALAQQCAADACREAVDLFCRLLRTVRSLRRLDSPPRVRTTRLAYCLDGRRAPCATRAPLARSHAQHGPPVCPFLGHHLIGLMPTG